MQSALYVRSAQVVYRGQACCLCASRSGSLDNCGVGGAVECVSLLGDELNVGGFGVAGRLTQGGQYKFHKVF